MFFIIIKGLSTLRERDREGEREKVRERDMTWEDN